MKPFLLLISLLVYYSSVFCQDYTYTGNTIPESVTTSTQSIGQYIQSHFKTDKEKFAAAYNWVINNIKYDKDSMYSINWSKGKEAIITEAMRRRIGVCENYAAIFCNIAHKAGLTAYVVHGYTGQNGWVDKTDHAWCAMQLNGEWLLCDPTWDYANKYSLKYFMVNPEIFIQTHIPYDPMWQLLEYPLSHKEFNHGATTNIRGKTVYNFRDSIMKFNQLNDLQQLEKTATRIEKEVATNQLIRNRLSYIRMLIAIENQDEDLNLYNTAVVHINKANYFYNQYLAYRNNGFSPATTSAQIYGLLDSVSTQLMMAKLISNIMENRLPSYQYDPGTLNGRIASLRIKLETEHEFLKNNFPVIKDK